MSHKDWSDLYQAEGNAALRAHFEGEYFPPGGTDGTASAGESSDSSAPETEYRTDGTFERPSFSVHNERFLCDGQRLEAGVWFHGTKGEGDNFDRFVCSPLHVEAVTSNEATEFGRLIHFRNSLGEWRQWAMPMHLLAGSGEAMRAELLDLGVEIDPEAHRLLNRYLQSQRPKRQVIAAVSTGWHSRQLFIMPRRNIGSGDAIFQSESANKDDYREAGTLHAWKAEIGERCAGNPILMLSVCAALAGPLLHHLQRHGGGFHLKGDSSTGKTTGLTAGTSVWGKPEQFIKTWRATVNGLEGIASQRNDTLLALDEIGEALPKEIGNTVYCLANGTGKARATRTGAAKSSRRWRVMVLSSGELSLNRHMRQSGQRARAGQEVRLLDISVRRSFGAWDNLHDMNDGRAFSDAIHKSAAAHYGHAGPRFVERLIESEEANQLPEMLSKLTNRFRASTGQESRAAERFAIAALAGELAISFDILDIPSGDPTAAMVQLFEQWHQERGRGQSEDTNILESINDFLVRHGDSMFSELGDTTAQVRDRAGWWKSNAQGRVWLLTSEGLRRAAPGHEVVRIADALEGAGWLADRGNPERAKKVKVNGRATWLYHIQVPES